MKFSFFFFFETGVKEGKKLTFFFFPLFNPFQPRPKQNPQQWACVPASALVAFLLLGIEEIGVAIEEPFSILPLENMWSEVDSEIRALAAASSTVSAMLSWEFDEQEEEEEKRKELERKREEERELSAGGAR